MRGPSGRLIQPLEDRSRARPAGRWSAIPPRAGAHARDPRPSRRLGGVLEPHEPAPLEAAQGRVVAAGAAGEQRRGERPGPERLERARWRAPSRAPPPPPPSAASPAGVSEARSDRFGTSGRPAPVPVPAAARARARAQAVDTYSRAPTAPVARAAAEHRPRAPRAARRGARAAARSPRPRSTTTPSSRRPAERHDEHAAHPHALHAPAEQVVERPAQGARGGERLDLGDHAATLRESGRPADGRLTPSRPRGANLWWSRGRPDGRGLPLRPGVRRARPERPLRVAIDFEARASLTVWRASARRPRLELLRRSPARASASRSCAPPRRGPARPAPRGARARGRGATLYEEDRRADRARARLPRRTRAGP